MIQISHLTRRFGSIAAVSDISFSVAEGEIVGFLGPNGAGKSTTMNMITGCLRATSGTVTVDGINTADDADSARRKIGYLPEQPPLYPDMTVEEYLRFVYQLKKCTLPRKSHLDMVCDMAGLSEVRERIIRNLSKGYRQRVGLAQALIGDPPVLILDEPTVGLDPKQIIEIREVIRSLGKAHTVLLSSHILPEVQAVCDRILVIDHGKIVADGTAEELSERAAGAEQLLMTIEGDPEAVVSVLLAVPGVSAAEIETEDGKKSIYRITAENDAADIRHNVFDALSQNMMAILSMQQVSLSLEDIFLELTGSDGAADPADEAEPETDEEEPEEQEEKPRKKRRLFGRRRGEDK